MAGGVVGRLAVLLGLDSTAFEKGLTAASKEANRSAKDIEHSFGGLGNVFSSLLGPLSSLGGQLGSTMDTIGESIGGALRTLGPMGSGVAAVGAAAVGAAAGVGVLGSAMFSLAESGAETIETFTHLSEKTGISREDLVAWGAVAKVGGTNLETFQTGVKRLEVAISGLTPAGKVAREVLQSIGVTAKDPQEALLEVADKFSHMEDGAQKAAIAVAIFGRSGTEMIPILDGGREAITKWQIQTALLASTIDKNAEAAHKWKEKTVELSTSWELTKVTLAATLGTLADLDTKFTAMLEKAGADSEAIQGRTDTLSTALPQKAIDAMRTRLQNEADQEGIANAQMALDLAKAKGPAEAKVLDLKRQITEAEKNTSQAGLLASAALVSQLIPLEKIAALEKSAREEAERRAAAHLDFEKRMNSVAAPWQQGELYLGPHLTRDQEKGAAGAASEALHPSEAPNIGGMSTALPAMDALLGVGPKILDVTAMMTSFNDTFYGGVTRDVERLTALRDMFTELHEKTGQDFSAQIQKLDQSLMHANYDLALQSGTVSFQQAFQNMFSVLEESGKNFAASLANNVGKAITELNAGLAQFIVTGKGLDAKKMLQGFAESTITSALGAARACYSARSASAASAESVTARAPAPLSTRRTPHSPVLPAARAVYSIPFSQT